MTDYVNCSISLAKVFGVTFTLRDVSAFAHQTVWVIQRAMVLVNQGDEVIVVPGGISVSGIGSRPSPVSRTAGRCRPG